jgi:hypothetical protein
MNGIRRMNGIGLIPTPGGFAHVANRSHQSSKLEYWVI